MHERLMAYFYMNTRQTDRRLSQGLADDRRHFDLGIPLTTDALHYLTSFDVAVGPGYLRTDKTGGNAFVKLLAVDFHDQALGGNRAFSLALVHTDNFWHNHGLVFFHDTHGNQACQQGHQREFTQQ